MGFPYTYGDDLNEEKARKNFQLFIKQYGPTLCVNGLLILLSKSAYAADKGQPGADPKPGHVAPAPADSPVFKSLVPPTALIHSKAWGVCGIGAISWICITAASTGNPALIFACSSLLLYAIGAKS